MQIIAQEGLLTLAALPAFHIVHVPWLRAVLGYVLWGSAILARLAAGFARLIAIAVSMARLVAIAAGHDDLLLLTLLLGAGFHDVAKLCQMVVSSIRE